MSAGLALRDQGIEQVADSNAEWLERAVEGIRELAVCQPFLAADDLRYLMEDWGIPEPTHHNAYGAAWSMARRRGLIEMSDRTRQSTRSQAHAHRHPVWKSLVWGEES